MGGLHFTTKAETTLHYANWLPSVGTWTHLVCVADSIDKHVAIWINGEKKAEDTFAGGANLGFHAAFNLGRRPGGYNDWFLAGSLDEIRVYSRALTDTEIVNLYALDSGFAKPVEIGIEMLRLTMHLVPGKAYVIQSSPDLSAWTDFGNSFTPTVADYQVSVTASESRKFWRVVETP